MTAIREPAFAVAERSTVPIVGSSQCFPVNRIFCVGRNYAAHAREMGTDPEREPPFFFAKPADAILSGSTCSLAYPPRTKDLHFEVELVVGLKSGGLNIAVENALDDVFGACVGIDFTRRDIQAAAKATRRPWDMGKGFDGSAVVGEMVTFDARSLPQAGPITLTVNGNERQRGDLSDMIWSTAEVIAELSTYLSLKAGDLIFTGTPDGVGPVIAGDRMIAEAEGVPTLTTSII
ncbi:MAG: fumarylacetoacetate hydrolase family protein [Hyphomicrobiales bacterium]|nr:fumarylacetoacetate hydrolase family protein [Hyphomicrobiales bacterium]MCP4998908.1 fumarylacetoacetate hydrolase family protein [Hyphomicrobiales bacterium]